MKKLFVTATITLACVAAFAQGKIKFVNDQNHLVYFSTDASMIHQGDTAGAAALSGISLDLYGGASAGSMSLLGTATLNPTGTPGTWLAMNVTVPGVAGGAMGYFEVFAYSTGAGSYAAAAAAAASSTSPYYGHSGVFTTVTGASLTYNSIVKATTPDSSTWAIGTQPVSGSVAGGLGSIALVANVPEPTSLALFGLGAAAMMIFRRRK